ncbi:MAG: ATP-dependent DNA ligase [Solirubrobacterales bacterium]
MALPLKPPVKPQLALSRKALPEGDDWAYEPKWDGFRALAFVDGGDVYVQSRGGKPLHRYFPELEFPDGHYILDGELVILGSEGKEEFNALQNRIHPAESRINRLAEETPAIFRAFDLLAIGAKDATDFTLRERREALEGLIEGWDEHGSVELTPLTTDPSEAEPWLQGGEGVIAKELSSVYKPGERKGMVKIKRVRTADVVVVGWRPGKEEGTVGALILGAYDGDKLRVVGHTSGLTAKRKRELVSGLAPYETGDRGSGDPSRWTGGRDLEWVDLRPELVVEITFDHVSADRIRHGAKLVRWRDDKDPRECTFEQLDQ